MSYPTVAGHAVRGLLYREAQVCLTSAFAGAYYLFFLSGSSTPADVYQHGVLGAPFSPTGRVSADTYGRFPPVYLDPSIIYRVQLFNSANVQQWQSDPYTSQLATVGTSARSAYGFQVAPTGEVTMLVPNTGGSGVTLKLAAGELGSSPLQLSGAIGGNSALIVNNSATTGTQTATFVATNKPGTATSSPAAWLPITCDGVQYYTPIWHGNNFTPYVANPSAVGEAISGSSITFGGNGITGAPGGSASPGNWFIPTTTNIGASYYINITRTSGTPGVNFSAAQGAWTNITSAGLMITTTATGNAAGTYQLSSSGSGSPVVASGTISLGTFAIVHVYTSGSGTESIPAGTTNAAEEVWGAGGGGGGAHTAGGGGYNQGGNGGAAGFAYSVYTASALGGTGTTFAYTVPAGGAGGGVGLNGTSGAAGVIAAGTVTGFTSMAANGGAYGYAATLSSGGAPGVGGTATGGNTTNTTGVTGATTGTSGSVSGDGSPYGGGGQGGFRGAGLAGQYGACVFYYT